METNAKLRGVRLSAQKGRLVADQIRGLPVDTRAQHPARSARRRARGIIKKVLESAIANAEHNDGADIDELKVKTIYVDKADVPEALQRARQGPRQRDHEADAATSTSPSATENKEYVMGQKIHPTGFRLAVNAQLGLEVVREQQELPGDAARGHQGPRIPEARSSSHAVGRARS